MPRPLALNNNGAGNPKLKNELLTLVTGLDQEQREKTLSLFCDSCLEQEHKNKTRNIPDAEFWKLFVKTINKLQRLRGLPPDLPLGIELLTPEEKRKRRDEAKKKEEYD